MNMNTARSTTIRVRSSGVRPGNPHVKAAVEHLRGIDIEDEDVHDAVLIPMPAEGQVDANGDEVTPTRHRQRIASSISYMKRRGKLGDMRIRVIQDLDGAIWLRRVHPSEVTEV